MNDHRGCGSRLMALAAHAAPAAIAHVELQPERGARGLGARASDCACRTRATTRARARSRCNSRTASHSSPTSPFRAGTAKVTMEKAPTPIESEGADDAAAGGRHVDRRRQQGIVGPGSSRTSALRLRSRTAGHDADLQGAPDLRQTARSCAGSARTTPRAGTAALDGGERGREERRRGCRRRSGDRDRADRQGTRRRADADE